MAEGSFAKVKEEIHMVMGEEVVDLHNYSYYSMYHVFFNYV